MHVISFYCPSSAFRSVNTPLNLIARLDLYSGDVERSALDLGNHEPHHQSLIKRFCVPEVEAGSIINFIDWLESEGLWYVYQVDNDIRKIFYPSEEEVLCLEDITRIEGIDAKAA